MKKCILKFGIIFSFLFTISNIQAMFDDQSLLNSSHINQSLEENSLLEESLKQDFLDYIIPKENIEFESFKYIFPPLETNSTTLEEPSKSERINRSRKQQDETMHNSQVPQLQKIENIQIPQINSQKFVPNKRQRKHLKQTRLRIYKPKRNIPEKTKTYSYTRRKIKEYRVPEELKEPQNLNCDQKVYFNVFEEKKTKLGKHHCEWEGCSATFTQKGHLKEHVDRVHKQIKNLQCSYPGCFKEFFDKKDLTTHQATHTKEKQYKCKICLAAFTTQSNRSKHERESHSYDRKEDKKIELQKYSCPFYECNKKFKRKDHLKKHLTEVHFATAQTCEICGQNFANEVTLRRHIKRVHERSQKFHCEICTNEFDTNKDLIAHCKNDHNGYRFACTKNGCDAIFKRKVRRDDHIKIVHRKESFKCLCQKEFKSSDALNRHQNKCTYEGHPDEPPTKKLRTE